MLNGIKKVVNKIVDAVGDVKDKIKDNQEENDKLKSWQDKFNIAKANYNLAVMDDREILYRGTKEVDANINSTSRIDRRKANNVVNILYEFTEAQVDTTIPQPSVRAKRKEFQNQAQMIEDSIKNDLLEVTINAINDVNERITPIQGFSLIEVCWNPDFKHHLYRGDIELFTRHPKQLIPQPGVFELQKMDHFFMLSSVSKQYIKKRYGVDITADGEQYPEVNSIGTQNYSDANGDKVTEIVVWYKDEDGDIGRFVWVDKTVLEDMPKFFNRKLERCTKCGQEKQGDVCECGSKKFKTTNEDMETLDRDIALADGTVIPAGTQIPYFKPTCYPVVVRKNVPVNFAFGGESDVDIIRDQQDAVKKVVSRAEEKILKGGNIITALDDHNVNITTALYQVVKGTQAQLAALNVKTLEAGVQQDIEFAKYMYDSAQSTLGITDSYLGKPDPTAQSGVAKQIQVQQSSGRLNSKRFNKYAAYKELFEIMFQFKLAFYDELRPYLKKGPNNEEDFGDFNKYELLTQDAAGEWYYFTDFLFNSDSGSGLPKDKMWQFEQIQLMYQNQTIDKVQYFAALESLQFPMASDFKKAAEDEKEMMAQQAQIQAQQQATQPTAGQPNNQPMPIENSEMPMEEELPPEIQQILEQYPPEIQQVLSHLAPEEIMKFTSQPREVQMQMIEQMMQQIGGGPDEGQL